MENKKNIILAIDDNNDNLISLKALIKEAFPDSIRLTASNGAAGIDLAQAENPDVILLDVIMPGMDGFEVCQKLKANLETSNIPVIFLTALKGDKESHIRALEVGADAFLTKPVDRSELTAQIRAMLKIKSANDQKQNETKRLAEMVEDQTRNLAQNYTATLNLLDDLQEENEARKKSETALRESEERLVRSEAHLIKAQQVAHVGSWFWYIEEDRLEWSEEMYRIFGYGKEKFYGRLADVMAHAIHPDDRAAVEKANRSVVADKKPVSMEYRVVWPNGTVRVVWAEAGEFILDNDGKPHLLSGIVQDITERKQAEAERLESEKRFRSLFENSPIALWEEDFSALKQRVDALRQAGVIDFDAYWAAYPEQVAECMALVKVIDVNKAALELYGAQNKTELLRGLDEFLVDESLRSSIEELKNIAEGKSKFSWEGINRTHDGRQINVNLNWSVVPGYEASLSKVIVSIVDITERKKAEAELLKHRDHLEVLVRERTAELEIAKEQAEFANRAKSSFLATMSHEIRTPLNGVLGMTQLTLQTDLTEKQRDYLLRIQISGEILLSTINDILDFSKIEAGKLKIEKVKFALDEVFHNLANLVEYRAQEKGLKLAFDMAPEIPLLLVGDPLRLEQVLLNLVGNAIKFTEAGEIVVKIFLQKESAQHVILGFSVRDTGIGMTEAQQARLFQPFTQADISTSRKYGGTGLGLTISQRLVKLMGGEISVKSKVGDGTEFLFTVRFRKQPGTNPLIFSQNADAPVSVDKKHAEALTLDQLRGKQVLLVEDNEINQLVATEMLKSMGVKTSVAESGEAALRLIAEINFDVVLMDIQMPGLDGYETTAWIRSDSRFTSKKLPIIAMTAHAFAEDRAKALEAGLNDYISKPVDINQLASTLVRWLSPHPESTDGKLKKVELEQNGLPAEIISQLDTQSALRRLGNEQKLYRRLLGLFREGNTDLARELHQALQENDLVLAHRLVHTLTGTAASIGAVTLSSAARQLELAIVAEEQNRFDEYVAQLEANLNRVLGVLANLEQEQRPAPIRSSEINLAESITRLTPHINHLAQLLLENDAQAVAVMGTMMELTIDAKLQEDIQAIENTVRRYDFGQARMELQLLAQKWQITLTAH